MRRGSAERLASSSRRCAPTASGCGADAARYRRPAPVYRESHRHPGLDRIDHLTCAISQIPHTHLHVRQRGTVTFPSPSPPRLTVRPYWRASAMRIACSGSTRWPAAAAASAIASCTPLIRPLNALLPGHSRVRRASPNPCRHRSRRRPRRRWQGWLRHVLRRPVGRRHKELPRRPCPNRHRHKRIPCAPDGRRPAAGRRTRRRSA